MTMVHTKPIAVAEQEYSESLLAACATTPVVQATTQLPRTRNKRVLPRN
jgi:hypothetical protein